MSAQLHVITSERSSPDVIEALEEVLHRARTDGVSSVCISWVNNDGSIENRWTKAVNGPALLAAVSRGMHRIAAAFGE